MFIEGDSQNHSVSLFCPLIMPFEIVAVAKHEIPFDNYKAQKLSCSQVLLLGFDISVNGFPSLNLKFLPSFHFKKRVISLGYLNGLQISFYDIQVLRIIF